MRYWGCSRNLAWREAALEALDRRYEVAKATADTLDTQEAQDAFLALQGAHKTMLKVKRLWADAKKARESGETELANSLQHEMTVTAREFLEVPTDTEELRKSDHKARQTFVQSKLDVLSSTRPTAITTLEESRGLTLEKKQEEWVARRKAAKEAVLNSGLSEAEIKRVVVERIVHDNKTDDARTGKFNRFLHGMGWSGN